MRVSSIAVTLNVLYYTILYIYFIFNVVYIVEKKKMSMWATNLGGEGRDMEEGEWDKDF